MRRPDKVGGVIRPRTLGLGKAAAIPEPPAPPPPPPPSVLVQNKRIVYGALLGFLILCLYYMFNKGGDGNIGVPRASGVVEEGALRTGSTSQIHSDIDDSEGEEDGEGDEDETPKKKSKSKSNDDTDAEEPFEEDGEEETDEDSKEVEEEEVPEEKVVKVNSPKINTENNQDISDLRQDRSKTVESYFKNFGGRVVEIDKEGSYKYVLVRMRDMFGGTAYLVRGCPHKEGTHCKHGDAYSRAKAELEQRGFRAEILGGGRITRHPSRHQKGQKDGYISIFGYSKTFGLCEECNKIACSLVKETYPNYGVKWANEGYLESEERKISDGAWTRC